jgi:hypothetical protein
MSAMSHRDVGQLRRLALTVLAVVAVAVPLAACSASKPAAHVTEIVVPPGTQDRLERGETVDIMPVKLTFRVGDTLRIRNNDRAPQFVGPYRVMPGETFELTYNAPGHFAGLCNLSGGKSYELVITK